MVSFTKLTKGKIEQMKKEEYAKSLYKTKTNNLVKESYEKGQSAIQTNK